MLNYLLRLLVMIEIRFGAEAHILISEEFDNLIYSFPFPGNYNMQISEIFRFLNSEIK